MTHVMINGSIVPAKKAMVSVEERGFRFGDGVFETIYFIDGIPFQWELHLVRLQKGLAALKIEAETEMLYEDINQLIAKSKMIKGFIRLSISRGIGSQGYLPKCREATVVIELLPPYTTNHLPVDLWLSTYKKPTLDALPVQCKLMQGVNSTLARMEASENGCFEAIQLNHEGYIAEGSSSNIFWIKGETLYTPALECGAVAGTTRGVINHTTPYKLEKGFFTIKDLLKAEEVFVTNTAWQIMPVKRLNPEGKEWNKFEKTRKLHVLLKENIAIYVAKKKSTME